ncbi:MAG: flagellar FliJ family protein [Alphaproteobacteria bacterium]
MKSLQRLIRVHKAELDAKRAALGVLERRRAGIVAAIEGLDAELRAERALAETSLDAMVAFPRYAEGVRYRRKLLEHAVADVDREIEAARAAVLAAFTELKRFEVTLERKREAARREALRHEQARQNELGLVMYRRRETA